MEFAEKDWFWKINDGTMRERHRKRERKRQIEREKMVTTEGAKVEKKQFVYENSKDEVNTRKRSQVVVSRASPGNRRSFYTFFFFLKTRIFHIAQRK